MKRLVRMLFVVCFLIVALHATELAQNNAEQKKLTQDYYQKAVIWNDALNGLQGKRIYVDMVGDLFHAGHVSFLKQVKALGGLLIVGLCGDDDCESYKRRPVLTLEERVEMLLSCRYVDAVLPNAPLVVNDEIIDGLNINLVVHGDDFNQEKIEKYYHVPVRRGIFQTVPYTSGISTTDLINRIKTRFA